MKIEIEKEFQPIEYIEKNLKLLRIQLRKSYAIAIFWILIGICIELYEYYTQSIPDADESNFSIFFFLFALYVFVQTIKTKSDFKSAIVSKSEKIKGKVKYTITEKDVIYSDMESELKYNWSCFTHFQLLDKYILITEKHTNLDMNSITINTGDIDKDSANELLRHLKSVLIEKGNKTAYNKPQ